MSADADPLLDFAVEAQVIYWRGPSPFFFAPIPEPRASELRRVARAVTYGWGMIPVDVEIGGVAFTTCLFPKDDGYLLPLKAAVRRKTNITVGDVITIEMIVKAPAR